MSTLRCRKGYKIASASTVSEGLAQLQPPPCCMVPDLTLPDVDGDAILRRVRAENLRPLSPFAPERPPRLGWTR
jgi:DNA-binding response OmpR family regulator